MRRYGNAASPWPETTIDQTTVQREMSKAL